MIRLEDLEDIEDIEMSEEDSRNLTLYLLVPMLVTIVLYTWWPAIWAWIQAHI